MSSEREPSPTRAVGDDTEKVIDLTEAAPDSVDAVVQVCQALVGHLAGDAVQRVTGGAGRLATSKLPKQAIDGLIDLTTSDDVEIRRSSALALGADVPEARKVLEDLVQDSGSDVSTRRVASLALSTDESAPSLDLTIEERQLIDREVRNMLAHSVGNLPIQLSERTADNEAMAELDVQTRDEALPDGALQVQEYEPIDDSDISRLREAGASTWLLNKAKKIAKS